MTNETFILLSDEKKNKKLRTILKNKSNNCLTNSEINIIMSYISLNKQYTIRIYMDPIQFLSAISISDNKESRTLLGSAIAGTPELSTSMFIKQNTAVILTRSEHDGDVMHYIHIYIPESQI